MRHSHTETAVGTIRKGARTEIRIFRREASGRSIVDLRTFTLNGRREFVQTQCTSLGVEQVPDLIRALQAADSGGGA